MFDSTRSFPSGSSASFNMVKSSVKAVQDARSRTGAMDYLGPQLPWDAPTAAQYATVPEATSVIVLDTSSILSHYPAIREVADMDTSATYSTNRVQWCIPRVIMFELDYIRVSEASGSTSGGQSAEQGAQMAGRAAQVLHWISEVASQNLRPLYAPTSEKRVLLYGQSRQDSMRRSDLGPFDDSAKAILDFATYVQTVHKRVNSTVPVYVMSDDSLMAPLAKYEGVSVIALDEPVPGPYLQRLIQSYALQAPAASVPNDSTTKPPTSASWYARPPPSSLSAPPRASQWEPRSGPNSSPVRSSHNSKVSSAHNYLHHSSTASPVWQPFTSEPEEDIFDPLNGLDVLAALESQQLNLPEADQAALTHVFSTYYVAPQIALNGEPPLSPSVSGPQDIYRNGCIVLEYFVSFWLYDYIFKKSVLKDPHNTTKWIESLGDWRAWTAVEVLKALFKFWDSAQVKYISRDYRDATVNAVDSSVSSLARGNTNSQYATMHDDNVSMSVDAPVVQGTALSRWAPTTGTTSTAGAPSTNKHTEKTFFSKAWATRIKESIPGLLFGTFEKTPADIARWRSMNFEIFLESIQDVILLVRHGVPDTHGVTGTTTDQVPVLAHYWVSRVVDQLKMLNIHVSVAEPHV